MKLLRLNLLAFGPFTKAAVELDQGEHGLHIVYGPNEAGKTSALRAVRQALFGIAHNSPDGFLHAYPDLRVGATVRTRDGVALEFIRRKGQKNTLRGRDDEMVLDAADLARCLDGVDENAFAKRFGIDYRELGEGGELVNQSRGSLGELLFAAGAGITDLAQIERRLQEEADELFVPRGSKPRLNKACADYADLTKRLKLARLPAAEWTRLQEELDAAVDESAKLEQVLRNQRDERERLVRFEQALPLIPRRRQWQQELATVANAVLLPESFGEQRLAATTALHHERSNEQTATEEIAVLERSFAEAETPAMWLENAPAIDAIVQQLGGYRKAQKDRPGLEIRRQQLDVDARQLLQDILQRDAELAEADMLRLSPAQKVRLQELAQERGTLTTHSDTARQHVAALVRQQEQFASQLTARSEPPETGEFERAIRRAQQQGNLAKRLDDSQQQLRETQRQSEVQLGRLSLWSGELAALEKLPVPVAETVDRFEKEFRDLEAAQKQIRERLAEKQTEIDEHERQLAELDLQHDVPSDADLAAARKRRDAGWQLVRQAWQMGQTDEAAKQAFLADAPVTDLAEAYRQSVEVADRIADRLRHEADRVSKKASLLAARTKAERQRANLQGQLSEIDESGRQIAARWSAVWQPLGFEPLSPREMRSWSDRHAKLTGAAESVRTIQTQHEELATQVRQHRDELLTCLAQLDREPENGESFVAVLEFAESVVRELNQQRDERRKFGEDEARVRAELPQAKESLQRAEEKLTAWQSQWTKEMRRIGLSPEATPAQAHEVQTALDELHDKRKQANGLRERIDGIDGEGKQFVDAARKLAVLFAPDLREEPVERQVETLKFRLDEARGKQARQDELRKKLDREKKKANDSTQAARKAQASLDALCQVAGCAEPDELPVAEQHSNRRRSCERDLRSVTEQLLSLSSGTDLDEFVSQAQSLDAAQLRTRREQLDGDVQTGERRQTELNQSIGELNSQLRQLGGDSTAAELEGQTFDLLARMQHDAERYARLRLASAVLRQAMERYREKNQGPVLRRAGELLKELTLGSFSGLRTDFDDAGAAILLGVRADGQRTVGVDGMSDGTRDQLYLALRLASLEHYLDAHPPFPFLVDDILVQFDNDRAVAALRVLAQLARRTQVIFFTHHEHLVRLAKANLDGNVLFTHELNCRSA